MTERIMDLSRRGFLGGTLASAGMLTLAVQFGCGDKNARRIRHADQTGELTANIYITILPDGRVSLVVHKAEIGQGVTTGYSTMAAEELSVPLDRVVTHFADSNPVYKTTFNMQITGGSTSTAEGYKTLRHAAAAAREMLVAAAAAQWKVPASECTVADGKVMHAASSKSAGYGELTKLAAHQPVPEHPRLKKPSEFTLIGKTDRIRVDARAKVDGSAKYGIDTSVPNMVNAVVIHGPQYDARATAIDDADARKHPGVLDVFGFEHGVAVVADKYWQALAASRAVKVTWGRGTTHGLDSEQLRRAMAAYSGDSSTERDDGDVDAAIGRAATKLDALYEAPYVAHATMEPQNAIVSVTGDKAEVWAPTQAPTVVQAFVGHALGISTDDVLVHTTLCGGGFGRRGVPDVVSQAALIARHVKRPVKLTFTREDDMTGGFYRPIYAIRMRGGVSADGAATALRADVVSQAITLSSADFLSASLPGIPGPIQHMFVNALLGMFATDTITDLFSGEGLKNTVYAVPNVRVTEAPVQTKMPVTTWRSVGNSVTAFAAESFVDELAHAAKADPLAFRKRVVKPGSRQARVLDALGQLSGWGVAPAAGIGRGMARHYAFNTEVGEVADVEIVNGRIRVRRVFCVVECGLAINPDIVKAQMEGGIIFGLSAALDQQISIVDGVVQENNFDTFPLLRMNETPEIVVQVLDSTGDPTGVGEPGLPPIAPAVANAVFAATGVRLRRMPLQLAWNEQRGGK
jgi:CO/xanthine dehydrogenase Mo-binding subunit